MTTGATNGLTARATWKQAVLRKVRGSVWLTACAYLLDNFLASLGVTRVDPAPNEHLSGANVAADVAYAKLVAQTYLKYGTVCGRTAEIGPGGSAAVALYLKAHGASEIDLLDRFEHQGPSDWRERTYAQIVAEEPVLAARRMNIRDLASEGIRFHVGEEAAAERFFRVHHGYDTILSCAVLEHLYDPLGALECMHSALLPGGTMTHIVDFRDHGMFTEGGFHELKFLTIPHKLYTLMSRRRGRPNRVLVNGYRGIMERLGFEYDILVSGLVGVGEIEPTLYGEIDPRLRNRAELEARSIRPSLASEFRDLSDAELAVSVIVLRARKPHS